MKIIILAGGIGTRLWPFSRDSYPKQFLRINDENSYLEKTLLRFLKIRNTEDIFIVTSKKLYYLVREQACQIDPKFEKQILVEPKIKNTGPAIAFAVKNLQNMGMKNDDCFLVSSSDYFIFNEEKFLDFILKSEEIAKREKLVIFGAIPNKPETGYGYIKAKYNENSFFAKVDDFIEKPSLKIAEEYLQSGEYLWNCGIFSFQLKSFLDEMNTHATELSVWLNSSLQDMVNNFSKMPNVSIDHCLMEKSKNIGVIPMNVGWSDIGCWDSIFETLQKDQNQNAKIGNIFDIDTKNSLIIGKKRLIATIGIEDMVIIDTDDAVFLGKRGESQRVKQLVQELKNQDKKETSEHLISYRPWGYFIILEEFTGYKVKKLVINPEHKLSLQFHYHRSEHWVVVNGTAKVTIGSLKTILNENESTYIPKEVHHRIENIGNVPLEIVEVQVGSYLGEDDIVRIDDIYERDRADFELSLKNE